MSEQSYSPVPLTMGHLSKYCDILNWAFLCHQVGDRFSVPLIYYTYSHHVSLKIITNSKLYVTIKFDENKSFDSLAMLEDVINYQLMNQ